ncbi:Gfo/Idh/MocA family protein [Bythopirellula goksoeyrii]|uniref:Putative oxidoreductase YvaA n=1 Tax=Bythopirellula goksoeyrii TaxID=1400387 RepID=A0A5B9Q6V1_9BACT|nr:Gfo/Idh/MocA family oxidoreductase [Bythopirellula goksoeyrii]QEG33162.1 putative oxidoreductase YvaA [Bythopirellula goksoeyrii]
MPSQSSSDITPSRRDFVKQSTAVVAGGMALATNLSKVQAGTPLGDKQIKVALIGCGGRGTQAAAQALSTNGNVTLWAMADAFDKRIEQSLTKLNRTLEQNLGEGSEEIIAEKIQVPLDRQFAGLDGYQKAIDSGVDLVILATPPGFRPPQFEAAIEAGKHVFTEKPLAVDAPGVRRVLAAGELADQKGLCVGVGLQRHHQPIYLETVKRLQEGAIGDILLTRVYWNSGPLWVRTKTDFFQSYGHEPTEMEYQVNNWYYFNWLCGDHIVEQHIHNIDVSNWVKQAHPVMAKGMGGRERRTAPEYGQIFDHHAVEFTYPDGSTMMSECRHMDGCWNQVAEFAAGTKGTADISRGKIITPSGEWQFSSEETIDPYQQEHDDLFAAIRSGQPYNEIPYGAESTMTAILGRMATYSGKLLEWDDAINSDIDISPKEYSFAAAPPVVPDKNGNYPVPVPGVTKVI